jgi:aminoglycoside 3-N-acetyltransferase
MLNGAACDIVATVVAIDEIAKGLRSVGLGATSTAVVHSSLRSFGIVDGGAATVADALVAVCGTVVVPSGTWDLTGIPTPPGLVRPNNAVLKADSWEEFDAAVDKAVPFSNDLPIDKELGAIPEAIRLRHPHARGRHPLFAFLASGSHASKVVAAERQDWPLGPLEVVAALDGVVVLLGVDHTANTTIHLAEQHLGRSAFFRYAKVAPGRVWAELPNIPGQSHRFDDIEPVLGPATREATIEACRVRVVPVRDVLTSATQLIVDDPGALLCADHECRCGAALRQRQSVI